MTSIWKLAFHRRGIDIETAWLILLGVLLCGFSMPFFGFDAPGYDLLYIWWYSFSHVLTIAILVTIISTIVIYGYEVWYLYYLIHEDDFKFITKIYNFFHQREIENLENQIGTAKDKYKAREELKDKIRDELLK